MAVAVRVTVNGQPTNVLYAGSSYGSTMYAINADTGAMIQAVLLAGNSGALALAIDEAVALPCRGGIACCSHSHERRRLNILTWMSSCRFRMEQRWRGRRSRRLRDI